MNTAAKLLSFAVAVLAAFGLGFGVGRVVGPFDDARAPAHTVHQVEDR